MGRAPCCDKTNVKKGPWSPEEDAKLKEYIEKYGTGGNWIALPQKVGLKRCGKSCRLRWLNYLRPNIKHGEFSDEEDRIIINLFANIGSRWSIIAAQLPGRTDNDIKNYWNTKLKKKLMNIINPPPGLRKLPQTASISSLLQHSSSSSSSSTSSSSLSSSSSSSSTSSSSSPSSFCGQAGSFTTTGYEPISAFSSNTILHVKQESYLGQMPYYQVNKDSLQQLMFGTGDQASCSSSDGSCNNEQALLQNNNFFHNGVDQNHHQNVMLSNGDTINVNGNGLWGSEQALLECFGLEEIKQLISSSTNTITTSSCSNFLFDENKTTEERVLYYY